MAGPPLQAHEHHQRRQRPPYVLPPRQKRDPAVTLLLWLVVYIPLIATVLIVGSLAACGVLFSSIAAE